MRRGWPLLVLILFGVVIVLIYDSDREDGTSPAPEPPRQVEGRAEDLQAPVPQPDSAELFASAGHMVLRGRVVNPDRRPVSGAQVVVRARDGREFRAVTGPDGSYEVEGGPYAERDGVELSIHVTHETGAVARTWSVSPGRPNPLEVFPLVLVPAHGRVVRVTYRGEAMPGARVQALFRFYGDRALLGSRVTDAAGECSFTGLPEGTLQFVATTAQTGRGLTEIELPRESDEAVEVVLSEPRPLRIRVLDGNDRTPVEGATLEVIDKAGFIREPWLPAATLPATGSDGWTETDGIGLDGHLQLCARRKGFPAARRAVPPVGAAEWVIRMPPYRTVTWLVVPGLAPVPPDGAEIRVRTSDGMQFHWQPSRGFMKGDLLHVPQCQEGYIAAYGIAPDGSIADLDYDIETNWGSTISFRPPRTVRVRITDSEGSPQAGLRLHLDVDGASLNASWRWTDIDGIACWENVYGNETEVTLLGMVLATLDLAKEDGDFEVTLEPRREVTLRVKLGGRVGLPKSYTLHIDKENRGRGITEDPEKGELCYGFHPPEGETSVYLRLSSLGYHSHSGTIPLTGEDPVLLDVDLVPVSVLSALVLPKDEGPFSIWYRIQLQRWEEDRRWAIAGGGQLGRWQADEDGLIHADDLEAGRYRFVHTESGIASKGVTLAAGERGQVSLDLSHVAKVSGQVVVPEGRGYADVRVVVDGAAPDLGLWGDGKPGRPVNRKTGRFEIHVPGDRDVLLRATHPLLACPEPVRIRAARKNVMLELVQPTIARLRIEPEPNFLGYWMPPLSRYSYARTEPWEPDRYIGVHLFSGPTPDVLPPRPPLSLSGGDVLEFQVPEGTTRDVLLDIPGLVPKLLPRVRFGPGVNDLGTVEFEKGSSLRVEVVLSSGSMPGRIIAVVRNRERPFYVRRGYADDTNFTVVSGLERGSYAVAVRVLYPEIGEAYPMDFERTVSIDGRKQETIRIEVP